MENKIRVFIPERTGIDVDMLINLPNIQLVDNPVSADFIIAQSTFDYPKFFSKTIYIAVEPPRAWHRILMYGLFDNFHTVICHNPDKKCKNQFPFTPDDSPQYFPTKADPFKFNTRTDTKLRNRGVFYAGMVNVLENTPDAHGGINITPLRQTLGKYFKNQFPDSIIIGIGWDGQQTKINDWRKDKHERIMKSNCDFVLALENTIYPNYLYEKIWDGFSTDYVTLYLGDPRIEHHIPTNCFIDLRPYFNIQTKQFDVEALGKRLKEMTQTEYDSILENARKFRETAHGKHRYYQIKLTQFIYDRMKHGKATFD